MKIKIYLLIITLFSINGFSQHTKMSIRDLVNFSDLPGRTSETPSWANVFYENPDQINIKTLEKEINDWMLAEKKIRKEKLKNKTDFNNDLEADKEFEKELKESISEIPIVRFSLRFIRVMPNEWIDEVGNFNLPTKNEFTRDAENKQKIISTANQKSTLVNNWSQIGAKEVIENGKQTVKSCNIYYLSIAPSQTNTRLACTENGALYKTVDAGENWSYLNGYGGLGQWGGPTAFHPTNPDKIIFGIKPARLSSDGGNTWTTVPSLTENCNQILWSNNGTTIIAAATNGVYVSTDSGLTFSQKIAGLFHDVEFKPGSTTVAYAINNQGVFYKSTDGGLTWTIKPTNYSLTTSKEGFLIGVSAANPDIVSIAFLTINEKTELIKSTNSGENFSLLSVLNTGYSQGWYDFVFGISPNDTNIYFVGASSLSKSVDGGLTANFVGGYVGPYDIHPDIQDLVFIGNTVVVATDGGVSQSTDNFSSAANWKSTCKGLDALDYWGFDLGFNTDQMGGGKYHNGNNISNPNWNNGKTLFVGGLEESTGKAIFSRPNSLVFFGPNPTNGQDKIFRLIDVEYNTNVTGTHTFTMDNNVAYRGLRSSDVTSNTIYSNIIYAGFENNLMISYDNGLSSQILKSFNSLVWDVKTTRADSKVIYVLTETDGLWKTIDGGLNWTICNSTINNVDLKPIGRYSYIDVSQTNANEIWITSNNSNALISRSTDGGQAWTDLKTSILNGFDLRQIIHQYGSNGGVYLMGQTGSIAKCFYRSLSMIDWIDYSANLSIITSRLNLFLKASYFKEKLRVASHMGVQEISFYEKSNPVAQPSTNIKVICVNQEVTFNDYSILDYTGATWEWSFSKSPVYLNGTSANSQNPVLKFLSPGNVNATLKVTNSSGISNTKTINNFVTINYDAASCLTSNSDYFYELDCVNNITNVPNIPVTAQGVITNFNNATSGKFLVKLNFHTLCYGFRSGSLIALIDLDTDKIKVIRFSNIAGDNLEMWGDNTSTVTCVKTNWAQLGFSLINNALYLNHISNRCADDNLSNITIILDNSCWRPYTNIGQDNTDLAELQKCNSQIPQSATVNNNSDILVTDFANATSGLFYINLNAFTSCNNTSNNLKAIVNLNTDLIHVLDYKHFGLTATSTTTGNETSSVTSSLTSNAQVNYFLNNNKLYIKRTSETCNGSSFRLNQSCYSALDDNQNGVDNALEPSICNSSLSTASFSDANSHIVNDFSSLVATQAGVFVNLNINSSCNNTNASIYLNIDFGKNLIHVINYKHFGSTTSSSVLNNDTPNVYSESALNGKLKFMLIDKKLYIQRLSTPCAGSNYQIADSCYSLTSQQFLAIDNFISNSVATVIAYPNPTQGSFTIDTKTNSDDFSLSFYDINGKFITPNYQKTDENLLQVNMEQYAEGLYFVILFNKAENKYNYLKIIKK